ncbi:hypothetical protein [Homoserinibacter gongjuensis]|uniref:hypothetical protein n=1 Tax=Homoserinibacter gongjuensis TaxID=1162968 RepID=UPI0024E051D2|nr:hypothetical protein [Homoserinibacter gongjuensis]
MRCFNASSIIAIECRRPSTVTYVVSTPASRNACTKRRACPMGISSSVECTTRNGGSLPSTRVLADARAAAGQLV